MTEEERREIDLNLASNFEKQLDVEKEKLPVVNDDNTSFDIYYNICEWDNKKYLYIKLIENTANAPFYYNISYLIEELYALHKIFKADDLEELKKDLKAVFKEGKITLHFNEDKSKVIMKLDVINFVTKYIIDFQLYREMIPQKEKDQKLLDLYALSKDRLKNLKKFFAFVDKFKGNKEEMKIIEGLKKIKNSIEIPGFETVIEKEDVKNENIEDSIVYEVEKEPKRENITNQKEGEKICPQLKKRYIFKTGKNDYYINLNLVNIFDLNWPVGEIQLKCDENISTLKPSKYDYPPYEVEKKQEGDFVVYFKKDDIKIGEYICKLNLYVNGVKLDNSDIELKIRVKKSQ